LRFLSLLDLLHLPRKNYPTQNQQLTKIFRISVRKEA